MHSVTEVSRMCIACCPIPSEVMLPSLVRAGACAPFGDISGSGPVERKAVWVQSLVVTSPGPVVVSPAPSSRGSGIDISWPEMPVTVEQPPLRDCSCSPRKRLVSFQGQAPVGPVKRLNECAWRYMWFLVFACIVLCLCSLPFCLNAGAVAGAQTRPVRRKLRALHDGDEIVRILEQGIYALLLACSCIPEIQKLTDKGGQCG